MTNNIPSQQLGKITEVPTLTGQLIRVQWAVVEQSQLVASNSLNGEVNPQYPQELQPLDRTTPESVQSVADGSKSVAFSRLSYSRDTSYGAPIVGPDLIVESGNGRVMMIRKAYADYRADFYRNRMIMQSPQLGIAAETIAAMSMPVVVRIRLQELDRAQFAKDSNKTIDEKSQSLHMYEAANRQLQFVLDRLINVSTAEEIIDRLLNAFTYNMDKDQRIDFYAQQLETAIKEKDLKTIQSLYNYAQLDLYHFEIAKVHKALLNAPGMPQWQDQRAIADDLGLLVNVPFRISDFAANYQKLNSDITAEQMEGATWFKRNYGGTAFSQPFVEYMTGISMSNTAYLKLFKGLPAKAPANSEIDQLVAHYAPIVDKITAEMHPENNTPETRWAQLRDDLIKNMVFIKNRNGSFDELGQQLSESTVQVQLEEKTTTLKNWYARLDKQLAEEKAKPTPDNSVLVDILYKQNSINADLDVLDPIMRNHFHKQRIVRGKKILAEFEKYVNKGKFPMASQMGVWSWNKLVKNQRTIVGADKAANYLLAEINAYIADSKAEPAAPNISINTAIAIGNSETEGSYSTDEFNQDHKEFMRLIGGNLPDIEFIYSNHRAHANYENRQINVGSKICKSTLWHELGHIVEEDNPGILAASQALLNQRYLKANEPKVIYLRDIAAYSACGANEIAVNNYVSSPYSHKFYPSGHYKTEWGPIRSSELISSGFEWLATDEGRQQLALDKAHLSLIIAAIHLCRGK